MPARYDDAGVIGTKWIGTALNAAKGLPHINAMIVINDIETAVVQGVMDGTVITAVRPAAVSLTAARRLARQRFKPHQLLSVRRTGVGASRLFRHRISAA